jgi:hypothetical protein
MKEFIGLYSVCAQKWDYHGKNNILFPSKKKKPTKML